MSDSAKEQAKLWEKRVTDSKKEILAADKLLKNFPKSKVYKDSKKCSKSYKIAERKLQKKKEKCEKAHKSATEEIKYREENKKTSLQLVEIAQRKLNQVIQFSKKPGPYSTLIKW